jgi:Flp pilus assembly protein TadD
VKVSISRLLLILLALVCVVLVAYWYVGECDFIGFDDDLYVSENPYVVAGLTSQGVAWALTAGHASTWQPLVWLSYMADSEIHGLNPSWFHRTNLLIHIANILLLFAFLAWSTKAIWRSAAVAALFALHPIHVESVAWVAERKDVLSGFFWFLTLICYTWYVKRGKFWRYSLVFLCLCLGLMAKPMLVTIPFVLLLLDYWPFNRSSLGARRLVLEKLPLLVPVAVSSLITYSVQKAGGSVMSLDQIPFIARLGNAPVFYVQYLMKCSWPMDLAILYPHPGVVPGWQTILAIIALSGVTVLVFKKATRCPFATTGWLWFLGTFVPVIGLVQIGLHGIADRFAYIPLIGIYILVVWGMHLVVGESKRGKWIITLTLVHVIMLLAVRTRLQTRKWKDGETLFAHATKVTENNWAMHNCLGAALQRQNRMPEATKQFLIAASINETRPRIHYNIGCALQMQNKFEQAIEHYNTALKLEPGHIKANFNLGCGYDAAGDVMGAHSHYQGVLSVAPNHVRALNNMGGLFLRQNRFKDAVRYYEMAIECDPSYVNARYNLGAVLYRQGAALEAAKHFLEVITIDPEHPGAKQALVKILGLQQSGKSPSTPQK